MTDALLEVTQPAHDSQKFVRIKAISGDPDNAYAIAVETATATLPTGASTSANQTLILNELKFHTNHLDDYTTTNVTYIGQEDKDGTWRLIKIDETGNFPVFTYASVSNNATLTTYTLAWTGRVTATYAIYSSAF